MSTKVSLYKTRNGNHEVWLLRWHADGKRHSQTLEKARDLSKREAEALRREKEIAFGSGRERPKRLEKITLAKFAKRDREAIQATVRPSTLLEYDHAMRHATAALGDDFPIGRITRTEVGRIRNRMANPADPKVKPRSPATIRKTLKTLGTMMRRAVKDGYARDNPFAGEAKGKTQSKPKRIFTHEEADAMIEASGSEIWWAVFLRFLLTTGFRLNEALNTLWREIDFQKRQVTVSRKDAERFTTGDRTYPILPYSAKTYEERTVPLPDATIELLQRLKAKLGGSAYVFVSLDRLALLDARMQSGPLYAKFELVNNLDRRFKVIQRRARKLLAKRRGVEPSEVEWRVGSIHDLRRSYGTWLRDAGRPLDEIQRLLGHADITTTIRFYIGRNRQSDELVRAALDGAGSRPKSDLNAGQDRSTADETTVRLSKIA